MRRCGRPVGVGGARRLGVAGCDEGDETSGETTRVLVYLVVQQRGRRGGAGRRGGRGRRARGGRRAPRGADRRRVPVRDGHGDPGGDDLNGVEIEDGVATVDLSEEFDDGGGSAGMFMRLAQIVFTLTQFPSVTGVQFELDGDPVETFSVGGDRARRAAGPRRLRGPEPADPRREPGRRRRRHEPAAAAGHGQHVRGELRVRGARARRHEARRHVRHRHLRHGLPRHVRRAGHLRRGRRGRDHARRARALGRGRLADQRGAGSRSISARRGRIHPARTTVRLVRPGGIYPAPTSSDREVEPRGGIG